MNFKSILKDRRKELGYTLKDIANKMGVTEATVQRWESGNIKSLRHGRIVQLADILALSPSALMGWEVPESKYPEPTVTDDYVTFPVIGDIAAGYDSIAVEDWSGDTVDIPVSFLRGRSRNEFFVLRVKGDSMFPEYHENDRVLILKQETMDYSGQIGAVLYDDECASLKRIEYVMHEDWMRLVPINPSYPPKFIEGESLEHCRVIGIPWVLIREVG